MSSVATELRSEKGLATYRKLLTMLQKLQLRSADLKLSQYPESFSQILERMMHSMAKAMEIELFSFQTLNSSSAMQQANISAGNTISSLSILVSKRSTDNSEPKRDG